MPNELDLRALFLDDAAEKIDQLSKRLAKLQKDSNKAESLREIFRVTHTLKSSASLEGYNDMGSILHEMETVLEKIEKNKVQLDEKVVDALFACVDSLADILSSVGKNKNSKVDIFNLVDRLKKLFGAADSPEEVQLKKAPDRLLGFDDTMRQRIFRGMEQNQHLFQLDVAFETDDAMRSTKAYLIYNNSLEAGEIIATLPSIPDIESGFYAIDRFQVFLLSAQTAAQIKRLADPGGIKAIGVKEIFRDAFEDMLNKQENVAIVPADLEDDNNQARASIRIDIQHLDEYMAKFKDMLGDLRQLSQIIKHCHSHNISAELIRPLEDTLARIKQHIEGLMKVSLFLVSQQLDLLFNRFQRLVKNLSVQQGKEVDFQVSASKIMLDKDMVDRVGETILHLLRNSVDHGIETPEQRLKSGKPRKGRIALSANTDKQSLIIQVSDDGLGFNLPLIKKIALEKEVITPQQLKKLSDKEVMSLVFRAGFSTKSSASQISGRGIGTDVVADAVKRIGGELDFHSVAGKGVSFTIKAPLSVCQRKQIEIIDMSRQIING